MVKICVYTVCVCIYIYIYLFLYLLWTCVDLHTSFPILNSQIYHAFDLSCQTYKNIDRLGSFPYIVAWVADGSELRLLI